VTVTHLMLVLIPILIVDAVNPILLGATVYCLGCKKPLLTAGAALLSFLLTYFLAGLVIGIFFEILTDYLHMPPLMDYILELIVAVLLFYFAWKHYRSEDVHPEEKLKTTKNLELPAAIALGFHINIIGLPFAIPYLAAIDQILKADLSVVTIVLVLLVYNVLYILPYAALLVIRACNKKKCDTIFAWMNEKMNVVCVNYMPLILLILALLLVEDAVSYLIGYREYSFLSLM